MQIVFSLKPFPLHHAHTNAANGSGKWLHSPRHTRSAHADSISCIMGEDNEATADPQRHLPTHTGYKRACGKQKKPALKKILGRAATGGNVGRAANSRNDIPLPLIASPLKNSSQELFLFAQAEELNQPALPAKALASEKKVS